MIKNGEIKYSNKCFENGFFKSKKNGKDFFYRSSWEKLVMEHLEKNKKVLSYNCEPFAIDYEFSGMTKKYLPDVLIEYDNGIKKMVEIKPEYQLKNPRNIAKIKAAENYCKNNDLIFEIWTDKDIENIKNITIPVI